MENNRCAHYFFEDLAVQNDAESSTMETVYTLSERRRMSSAIAWPSLTAPRDTHEMPQRRSLWPVHTGAERLFGGSVC